MTRGDWAVFAVAFVVFMLTGAALPVALLAICAGVAVAQFAEGQA
mgnify:CR=1 FL=1